MTLDKIVVGTGTCSHDYFSERRTMALVCKLEKYMMQLVQIMHKVVELTIRYENHRIGKDN